MVRCRGEGLNATRSCGALRHGSSGSAECGTNISPGSYMLQCIFFFEVCFSYLDKLRWKGNTWQKDGVVGTNKCLLCFIDLKSIMKVLRELLSVSLQQ